MDAKQIQQQAQGQAKGLNIDEYIRIIAKSGTGDNYNYAATWEGCRIRATFGAGTNSASVMKDQTKLYSASDYGQYVDSFRFGPWVDRLIASAKQIEEENKRQKAAQDATKDQAIIEAFSLVVF